MLDKSAGALGKMLPVFTVFAGGPLGTGQQWCSWVHRDDLVSLFVEAITNQHYKGEYNATAPEPGVLLLPTCAILGARRCQR